MFFGSKHGGVTLEYIILSTFTAIACLGAMALMKKTMNQQMHKMTQQLDLEVHRSEDGGVP